MPTPPPPASPGIDPQVIAMVGLICSIIILLTYLKIVKNNCDTLRVINLSRRLDQRRQLNEHLEEFSATSQSRGLDSCLMHALPITQVDRKGGEKWCCTECTVCLAEFEDGEWVKRLPICSHAFHVSCIDTWFQTHSSCPLCRSYVCDMVGTTTPDVSPLVMQALNREDFNRSEHYRIAEFNV